MARPAARPSEQTDGAGKGAGDVSAKVQDDSTQGADMKRHIKGYALILNVQYGRHQNQVGRGGDGQELGNALNQRQKDKMPDGHARLTLFFRTLSKRVGEGKRPGRSASVL